MPSQTSVPTHSLLSSKDASPAHVSKWQKAAAIIVANRGAGESAALTAVGDGLLTGDYQEAAHIW